MTQISKKRIQVAMVMPPFGQLGGPEIAAHNLALILSEYNVDVTIFAPADWKTSLLHIPTLDCSLWNMKNFDSQTENVRRNLIIESQLTVLKYQDQFDIIHLHSSRYAYTVAKLASKPCVLTFHNKIAPDEFKQIISAHIATVSISQSQKQNIKTTRTIQNGVTVKKIPFSEKMGQYLIFVGRLCEQKGAYEAVQIALKSKLPLLLFGRIGLSDERQIYYNKKIKPYLSRKIKYKGEVSHSELLKHIRNARAVLLPTQRPEVWPNVIIESLSSGTPVITSAQPPFKEMLGSDKIGKSSNNINELVDAVKNIRQYSRYNCREYAQKKFNGERMAIKYISLYAKLLNLKI